MTLSNWFDCGGRNPNVLWHKGSVRVNFANPCSIHQKVDPVTGQKVMNFIGTHPTVIAATARKPLSVTWAARRRIWPYCGITAILVLPA